jgi:hypothetical protein
MALSHTIGFEIADNEFRLVDTESIGHILSVTGTGKYATRHNYSLPEFLKLPYDKGMADDFLRDVTEAFIATPRIARRVAICLPTTVPLITVLPLEREMSEKEKLEHMEWESRILLGCPAGTGVTVHSTQLMRSGPIEERLIAALPNNLLESLKQSFNLLGFTVASIRIRHFLMEEWIEKHMAFAAPGSHLLLGMFDDYAAAAMYRGNQYEHFRLVQLSSMRSYEPQVLRLVQDSAHACGISMPESIYAYGPGAYGKPLEALSVALETPLHPIAPYLSATWRKGEDHDAFMANPDHYEAPLCSVAGSLS